MYPTDAEAKQQILEIGRRMDRKGFVAANDGNLTVKVGDDAVWSTPTGVAKGTMTEDMLVKLDLDGKILESTRRPSSEAKMHLAIYKEDPTVGAVCHAHPTNALVFASAERPLDLALIQEAVVLLGVVPVAPFALPGSQALADSVVPFVKTHRSLLLAHHGVVTWGKDLEQAFFFMESTETLARVTLLSELSGLTRPLTEDQITDLIALRANWGLDPEVGGRPKGR